MVGVEIKIRDFEVVSDANRVHKNVDIVLPTRADAGSAGYDFVVPVAVTIPAHSSVLVWTDVKAYMQRNEVLEIYMRSSVAIKKGIILKNIVPIIDSSYYNNEDNEGNIGLCLCNTTDTDVTFAAYERVAQGIFKKYLITDTDIPCTLVREGGFGSSGV